MRVRAVLQLLSLLDVTRVRPVRAGVVVSPPFGHLGMARAVSFVRAVTRMRFLFVLASCVFAEYTGPILSGVGARAFAIPALDG